MGAHSKGRSEFGTRFTYGGAIEPVTKTAGIVVRDYEREIELPFAFIEDVQIMTTAIMKSILDLRDGAEVLLGLDEIDKDLICLIEGTDRPYFGHPLGTYDLFNNLELPVHLDTDFD